MCVQQQHEKATTEADAEKKTPLMFPVVSINPLAWQMQPSGIFPMRVAICKIHSQ